MATAPRAFVRLSTRLLLSLGALAAGPAPADASGPAVSHFTIRDQVAAQEVSEQTDIYIDGRLLGHLHLNRDHDEGVLSASIAPGDGTHIYALCGEITVQRPDGRPETHEVNSTGTISDVDGRSYQALGASDFTFFYLSDPAPGRAPSQPDRRHSPLCHPPLS